jgi:hypothetical protein
LGNSSSLEALFLPSGIPPSLLISYQTIKPKLQWIKAQKRLKAGSANLKGFFLGGNARTKMSVRKPFISRNPETSLLKPAEKADEKSIAFDCKPVKMIVTVVH